MADDKPSWNPFVNAKKLATKSGDAIEEQTKETPADEAPAPTDESPLARMQREAEESARKQEEEMHKKNIGVGGVNAGKL
jgi:hypothetical protein